MVIPLRAVLTCFVSQALLAITEAKDHRASEKQGRLDAMAEDETLQRQRHALSAELVALCASRDSARAESLHARSDLERQLALLAEANQVGNCIAACTDIPSFFLCVCKERRVDCRQGRSSSSFASGTSQIWEILR